MVSEKFDVENSKENGKVRKYFCVNSKNIYRTKDVILYNNFVCFSHT